MFVPEAEKARIQGLFDLPNRDGSVMQVVEADGEDSLGGLIDHFEVLRVAPHFDAAGNLTQTDFWLHFRSVGYFEAGQHYCHTVKVLDLRVGADRSWFIFTDDQGRKHYVNVICEENDAEWQRRSAWESWQAFRAENQEEFARADADILEEHIRIAEGWSNA